MVSVEQVENMYGLFFAEKKSYSAFVENRLGVRWLTTNRLWLSKKTKSQPKALAVAGSRLQEHLQEIW